MWPMANAKVRRKRPDRVSSCSTPPPGFRQEGLPPKLSATSSRGQSPRGTFYSTSPAKKRCSRHPRKLPCARQTDARRRPDLTALPPAGLTCCCSQLPQWLGLLAANATRHRHPAGSHLHRFPDDQGCGFARIRGPPFCRQNPAPSCDRQINRAMARSSSPTSTRHFDEL